MSTLAKADLLRLSVHERILLVEDLWDSIAAVPDAVHLTEAQKTELDRRLDLYHQHPDQVAPWGVVREAVRKRS